MKRRSKLVAAILSLLICLNGMQIGAFAAANDESTAAPQSSSSQAAPAQSGTQEDDTAVTGEDTVTAEPEFTEPGTQTPSEPAGEESTEPAKDVPQQEPAADDGTEATSSGTSESVPENVLPVQAPRADRKIYVSATGSDDSTGSEDAPYATLAKAIGEAQTGDTIVLLSDMTVTSCVRVTDKQITIDGSGYSLLRGDNFATIGDNERSFYNPGFFEVTTSGVDSSLRLVNITLDDQGKHMGSIFAEAPGKSDGADPVDNRDFVQEGMLSAYGLPGTATATITLGSGAVLQNFGGMSAVHITGGAALTMESGSLIQDTTVTDRVKGAAGSNGPAGAVWVQGAAFVMQEGSKIENVAGRGVYADNAGRVTISGTITGIKADAEMWQGRNGVAVHNRNGSNVVLTGTSVISNISSTAYSDGNAVLGSYASNLEMQKDAVMTDVNGLMAVYMDDMGKDYSHTSYIDGVISNVVNNPVMRSWYGLIHIGPNGIVQNCTAKDSWTDGQLLYTNNGSHYVIEGSLLNNKGTVLYIANQSGARPEVVMKAGAVISGTRGAGLLGSGVAVRVNNGALFTMEGGTITDNGIGVQVSGKTDRKGVTFVMNGGAITGNKTGISYTIAGESVVELNAGTISGNGTSYQITATGGSANHLNENLKIAAGVLQGNTSVSLSAGTVTLDESYKNVSLGTASSAAKTKLTELIEKEHATWETAGSSALWIEPTESTIHFQWKLGTQQSARGLYVAYIPLNADGTPAADAALTMKEVKNTPVVDITLDGLTSGTAYAVLLVNNDVYTVSPDRISIYTGGSNYETTGGLPEDYTLAGLDAITKLNVNGTETTYSRYNEQEQEQALSDLKALLTVEYTDAEGNILEDDSVAGEYTARITWNNPENVVKINDNNVALKDGVLIIRPVTEPEEAAEQQDDVLFALTDTAPTAEVEHATAVKISGSTYTINNDPDRELTDQSALSLLDDDLLTQGEDNRRVLMEMRGDEVVQWGNESAGVRNEYEFHYLDLVDPNTGNAWVASSEGLDVFLPYPEGTTKDTEFQLLHYKDLHREYGIEGQANVEQAIRESEIEIMSITRTDYGISFHVTAAGFSPFALVWQTSNQAPSITAADRTITVGDAFDVMQGVTASDPEEGDITANVEVTFNNVDPKTPGTYTVTYRVADRQGASAEKTITVTVVEDKNPEPPVTPETPSGTPTGSNVQTGDSSQPMLWAVLLVLAAVLAGVIVWRRRAGVKTK